MIRNLLASTALVSLVATAAFAQDTTTTTTPTAPAATDTMAPATTDAMAPAATDAMAPAATTTAGNYLQRTSADQYLASDLSGLNVYQSNAADAASSGEIENLLINADGTIVAAIIETDGLADDKTVAVPFNKLTWSNDANNAPRAVLTATAEELSAAPEFSDDDAEDVANNGALLPGAGTTGMAADGTNTAATTGTAPVVTNDMAAAPATTDAMAPATTDTAAAPATTDMAAAPAATTTPAATTAADANGYLAMAAADQYLSDDIVGEKVYSGPAEDADAIGDVNDLVIDKSGKVAAAVVGVGGFLGLGEKNVAVPFSDLTMAMDEDGDDVRAVLAATKEQLTAAPLFEIRSAQRLADSAAAGGAAATGAAVGGAATAVDNVAGSTVATPVVGSPDASTTASTNGDLNRTAMTPATGAELTSERLVGTTIYGPNDENIGSVGDIALTAEGQVDAIIVDVGGFLGLGKKPVAVAMDNLQFMKDSGGSLYLYTQFTEDQLKAAPEYNRDSYAENRATMRIEPGATLPTTSTDDAMAPTDGAMAPAPSSTAAPAPATAPAQ